MYGSLPLTPRRIIEHSLHTQFVFLLLSPVTWRANPSNHILLPCGSQMHTHRGATASTETCWNLRLILTILCSSCFFFFFSFFLKRCCFCSRLVRGTAQSHPICISSHLAAHYLQHHRIACVGLSQQRGACSGTGDTAGMKTKAVCWLHLWAPGELGKSVVKYFPFGTYPYYSSENQSVHGHPFGYL